ncbi:MAG: hypothetical protein ACRENK_13420 [Gemmatimonadaceae bacterium]
MAGCRGRQHTADASSTANTTPRATAHHTRLPGGSTGSVDTTASPRDVVRRYYDAIQRHDYDAAYALWSDGGKASNQTRPAFAAGFAQTAEVRVNPSDSVVVEGAAGSQYATVPVAIDAVLRDGQHQHFDGTYTLRRSMVDGATPEQLQWRIYSSDLRAR